MCARERDCMCVSHRRYVCLGNVCVSETKTLCLCVCGCVCVCVSETEILGVCERERLCVCYLSLPGVLEPAE